MASTLGNVNVVMDDLIHIQRMKSYLQVFPQFASYLNLIFLSSKFNDECLNGIQFASSQKELPYTSVLPFSY